MPESETRPEIRRLDFLQAARTEAEWASTCSTSPSRATSPSRVTSRCTAAIPPEAGGIDVGADLAAHRARTQHHPLRRPASSPQRAAPPPLRPA